MQDGKNWILTKEINAKGVLLRLSLARNLDKTVMSLFGNKWRKRVFRLRAPLCPHCLSQILIPTE
jgi:hypothetical protein